MSRFFLFMPAAVVFACPSPALSYLDPGTGGMLLQLLLGGAAGLMVVLKLYWHRIRETARRLYARMSPSSNRKPPSSNRKC